MCEFDLLCLRFLDGVKPAEAADYIELRDRRYKDGGPGCVIQSTGTKCASATDKAACEEAIAAVRSTEGFSVEEIPQRHWLSFLVVNRGDNVEVVDTEEGVKALLAPIDAPSEAAFSARS